MANILTLIFSFGQVGPAPAPSGAYRVNNFDSLSKNLAFFGDCVKSILHIEKVIFVLEKSLIGSTGGISSFLFIYSQQGPRGWSNISLRSH